MAVYTPPLAEAVRKSIGMGIGVEAPSQWEGCAVLPRRARLEPMTPLASELPRRQGGRGDGGSVGGELDAGVATEVRRAAISYRIHAGDRNYRISIGPV